jgi:hypothetical protein
MKILVFMNMPAGSASLGPADPSDAVGYLTHQIILNVPDIGMLIDLPRHIADNGGLLCGEHMIYERVGREKVWKRRGQMLINMAHVGKIAPYFDKGVR